MIENRHQTVLNSLLWLFKTPLKTSKDRTCEGLVAQFSSLVTEDKILGSLVSPGCMNFKVAQMGRGGAIAHMASDFSTSA